MDSFHKIISKTFTFDNGHKGTQAALSHIDCFYISLGLDQKKNGNIEIAASMKQFSNHSLILLWIHSKILMKPPTKVFFDITMFKNKVHQIKMVKAWQEAFSELKGQEVAIILMMTINRIVGCNVHITKDKWKCKHEMFRGQTKKTTFAKNHFPNRPTQ